jgi:hypothetical protein
MPRSASLTGLLLAALIALTACSSTDTGQGPASPAASSAVASSHASEGASSPTSSPATDGSSPGTTTAEGTGTYSSAELSAILGSVTQADGTALQVIPTAQIEQSMDQARQFLAGVTVTPAECAVFVSNSFEAPEGAGIATGISRADGDGVQTIVSAASAAEIASRDDAATTEALTSCSSISIEAVGVAIEQTVEAVDATTEAERTVGTVATQTSADGAEQQTMTIVGTRGDLALTAVRTAQSALPEGTQQELQDLVDAALVAAGQG